MGFRCRERFSLIFLMLLLGWPGAVAAVPTLQVYIDGATYDPVSETWITTATSFDLWVLGVSPVDNVMLSVAFMTGETGSITLTPTTAGDFDGVLGDDDTSTPGAPVFLGTSADGDIPVRGDGSLLPTHGVYGPGVSFLEYDLGDFTLTDSPIGDYQGIPASFPAIGQINVYSVVLTGFASGVHFDTYDSTVTGKNGSQVKYVFAPFSHDAGASVPEPSAGGLLAAGVLASWLWRRSMRRRSR
jgi:hypothetical protein